MLYLGQIVLMVLTRQCHADLEPYCNTEVVNV